MILPLNISCGIDDRDLGSCSKTELDVSQCPHVAGVNCGGQSLECCTLDHNNVHVRVVAIIVHPH